MTHQKFPTKACWGGEGMLTERKKARRFTGNSVAFCVLETWLEMWAFCLSKLMDYTHPKTNHSYGSFI